MERTAIRTCPLCEATCGLTVTVDGDQVTAVRGDADDVFSHGFLCPKGVALEQLHNDPDRIETPLIKQPDGTFAAATWDEAFDYINERLTAILARDRNAVATYLGNPNAHLLANMLYGPVLLRALGSNNRYSASTVDQFPKQMAAALMFGTGTTVPVPDVDRTDYLLILGANPLASNGSLMTAPDMRGRLKKLRARRGKLVVIDPRRSRTAEAADEHHFIRPGTDALLLFALVNVLFEESLTKIDERIAAITNGIETVAALCEPFTPEAVAPATGIAAAEIRNIAHELADAPTAAVYGRIGTCTQEFGTTASWLVDVINVLTGNLDREGGAMFPLGAAGHSNAAGPPGRGRGARFGRFTSRVRELPEIFGELPVACLAEEIETPGEGQVKALITVSGNPVVSTPNSERLAAALDELELMVSLDIYVNETTRHADVILPGLSPLRRSHYDLALYLFAVRNVANYSPPVLAPDPNVPDEWVTLLRLAGIAFGLGPNADVEQLDEQVARTLIDRELKLEQSPFYGRTQDEVLAELAPRVGPERLLDLQLRAGPYRLTLADLENAPHGIDLGPLKQRLPDALRTASGMIELAPEQLVADVPRLEQAIARTPENGDLVLVGRRHLRSNNSWMHNLPLLVSGPTQCTLHVHPDDASRHDLVDGEQAEVRSRTGTVHAQVEVTDAIMPGVVSLPHGWGHDGDGRDPSYRMRVAAEHAGTNSNILADELLLDPISGNAVLNGIPVELAPVRAPVPA
ncbi:MAG TPA: molybdopterin-dependent oxidoreductase [Solirubrobacteraceae bacterium]|nr:molybdopterin-dependent oxidoreductase [Solirubrobacteraceae bacterium]